MARQSVADVACAKLDAKISDLMKEIDGLVKAKQIIYADEEAQAAEPKKPRKPRGPNKRRAGLPQPVASNGE